MESKQQRKKKMNSLHHPWTQLTCNSLSCLFCIMKEQDPCRRKAGITKCFKEMPKTDDQEHVLVLSGLWNLAMTQPDDPVFPTLGIFECMASFINKGITNKSWLYKDQNIYIPYYAAHIIGSYTIDEVEFAEMAVQSGVVPPLIELLKGKLSWVEQRVAVRALGHLASHERTFDAVASREDEIVLLSMNLASTCLDLVYSKFVGVKDRKKRLRYQCDLLTRGLGNSEMENRKAEEWASQMQCWSIYLLNCFASKERCLGLICRDEFLKDLCNMWGGLVNDSSPAGVGLLRILCHSKMGRKCIANCEEVLENLCNLSRSSDDWQYIGIDCILLLLKDPDTRFNVMEVGASFLVDLVEIRDLSGRRKVGAAVTEALLHDFKSTNCKNSKGVEDLLELVWHLKAERKKREREMTHEELQEKKVLVAIKKQEGNERFWAGEVEEAVIEYTEALDLCPLKRRKERVVLYSNRAQCYLLLRNSDAAVSDATRALCLSNPTNSHRKSLWRRSQAYDMKGLAKESLMDSIMFVNGCFLSRDRRRTKIPYYAARMINKQMNATWLFASGKCVEDNEEEGEGVDKEEFDGDDDEDIEEEEEDDHEDVEEDEKMVRKKQFKVKEKMGAISGLSTIIEEPWSKKGTRRKPENPRLRKKEDSIRSSFH